MWTEVIFSRDDLARLLAQTLPLKIHLGAAEDEHSLSLRDLGEVTLVTDAGLRLACKATVHWPLLGIDVPVELSTLRLLLVPSIEPGAGSDGERLVLRCSVEDADFSALPGVIGDRVVTAINARLADKNAELSWCFSSALRYLAPLPSMLEPLESFAIRAAWGKIRITEEAIVCAASFHSTIRRRGDAGAPTEVALSAPLPSPAEAQRGRALGLHAVSVGAVALAAAAAAFLFFRRARW
jgi:hypothetical protein